MTAPLQTPSRGVDAAHQSAKGRPGELIFVALGVLKRRFWLYLVLVAALALGGLAGVYLKRMSYESTAKLLVNMEGLSVSLSQADVPQTGPQIQPVEAMTSLVELMTSKVLLEQAVDRIGEEKFSSPPPSSYLVRLLVDGLVATINWIDGTLQRVGLVEPTSARERLLEQISSGLYVYPVRQSQIIVVGFRWRNKNIPPIFLKTLLEIYVEKAEEIENSRSEFSLFSEQVALAAKDLDAAEAELREFESTHDIVDLAREKQTLEARIDQLTELSVAPGVTGDEGAPNRAPDSDAGRGGSGLTGAYVAELRSRLGALRLDRAKALASYTSEHRTVRELDSQIREIEAALERETARVRDLVAASRERLRTLQKVEQNHNRIKRNIDIATQAYQTYRKVAADRAVMLAHQARVHLRVVDPPDLPVRATGPGRLILAMMAMAFAVIGAALLVLLLDALGRRGGTSQPPVRA